MKKATKASDNKYYQARFSAAQKILNLKAVKQLQMS